MVAFYRDTLGFTDMGESQSIVGTMHRLVCGTSHIKLVRPGTPPPEAAPPGGVGAATGYRYWTISVPDLAEVLRACEAAGRPVVLPPTVARPGDHRRDGRGPGRQLGGVPAGRRRAEGSGPAHQSSQARTLRPMTASTSAGERKSSSSRNSRTRSG